jgi:hypothetical protein
MAGDEARSHLKSVKNYVRYFTFSLKYALPSYRFNIFRMMMLKKHEPKLDRWSEAQMVRSLDDAKAEVAARKTLEKIL